jgi:hypothetical protein
MVNEVLFAYWEMIWFFSPPDILILQIMLLNTTCLINEVYKNRKGACANDLFVKSF